MVGDGFEVNVGVTEFFEDDEYLALKAPGEYFNTDLRTDIVLHCNWLSLKTINLQHLILTGEIPKSIQKLVNLEDLYSNSLI